MTADQRELILQQGLNSLTSNTITDTARLREELEVIYRRGYATAMNELEVGLMAAGTPIRNHAGQPIAAISIEGPDTRIDESRLHELGGYLVTTARQISNRLGYREAST